MSDERIEEKSEEFEGHQLEVGRNEELNRNEELGRLERAEGKDEDDFEGHRLEDLGPGRHEDV